MKRILLVLLLSVLTGGVSVGQTWTWPGDLREHMRDHGVNVEGKSFTELRAGHDYIHNITQQGTPNADDWKLLAQCPNGQCPPGWGMSGGIYFPTAPPRRQRTVPQTQQRPPPKGWVGGLAKIRVRHGQITDYGSAVNIGYGRTKGEWIFLTCAHNLESGQIPELFIRGQWVAATVLYRDKLAPVVNGMRTADGPDRGVVAVRHPEQLRFRRPSSLWKSGPVELGGFPGANSIRTIGGVASVNGSRVRAELQRSSSSGYSGGGLFSANKELVGIWTSGANGRGYAESIDAFAEVFEKIGWMPGSWAAVPFPYEKQAAAEPTPSEPTPAEPVGCPDDCLKDRLDDYSVRINSLEIAIKNVNQGVSEEQIHAAVAAYLKENADSLKGEKGDPGDSSGWEGISEELDDLRNWERRVLLVNSKTNTVIDDEKYGKDDPIVIDVNRLTVK